MVCNTEDMTNNVDTDINEHSDIQAANSSEEEMIAVVGMSCLLPGGISHYDDFWSSLVSGIDQRSVVPFSRWNASVYFNSESTNDEKTTTTENSFKSMLGMTNTNHGYFLPDNYLTDIDPSLFYLSPAEVPSIDPQQRLLLKLSLSCFNDAGIIASKLKGSKTGVFIGVMNLDYGNNQSNRYLNINEFTSLGLSNSISSNRISYTFDLRGPSMTVDTACSSSAVCIHHAMNSLRKHETDMCLIGGINVLLSPRVFVTLSQMNLLSPDGRCKAFDEKGDGYARGEGGGMLLLKRLSDAIRDKDRIHGLLVSSCINQDGRSSIPITSPNIQSQIDLYTTAYKNCKLNPSEVQYIEAHGTGTAKGDAIEIASIQSFFLNEQLNSSQLLRIGSVKTNIGHLESGAGVIGVMKSLLCLKHAKFVPSLHFNNYPSSFVNVHPHLKVQTSVEDWLPIEAKPRFCGVNSFGYGGTNAHIIVMEYLNKKQQHSFVNDNHNRILPYILPISAKNKHALPALMQDHIFYLTDKKNPQDLEDYCYTLACRKLQFNHRAAIIGTDHQSLIEQLESKSENNIYTNPKFLFSENTKLTFLFGGQGSQCIGMGLNLMCFPIFAEHMIKIDEWTRKNHNWSLLHSLKEYSLHIEDPNVWTITQTTVAIFAVETSTAFLLANYGVYPSVLTGHSAGEFAALYCSRLLDLDTLLSILWTICTVSMDDSIPKAQIVEIRTSLDHFQLLLTKLTPQYGVLNVEVACINSPQSITVAGYHDHIEIIKQYISVNRFNSYSVPFHTSLMEVIKIKAMQQLEQILKQRKTTSISADFFPTTTNGDIVQFIDTNGLAYSINNPENIRMKSDLPFFTSPYWWNIVRAQVNFPNQINTMMNMMLQENGASLIMLDLSPQPVLTTASLLCTENITKHQDFPCTVLSIHSTYEANALIKFASILAELYVNGYSNDKIWSTLYPMGKISDSRYPPIPCQNSSYWSESLESLRSRMLPSYGKQLTSLLTKFYPIPETNVTNRDYLCICLYEAYIEVSNWLLIQQHVFENSMLIPAAYYFEIFFAIGNSLLPNINYRIKNVQLKEAFWMDQSDDYYIKLEVKPKSLLSFEINVFGCSTSKEVNSLSTKQTHSLTLFSTAILEYDSVIPSIRKRQLNNDFIELSEGCNSTQFYQTFRDRGFNYGESFSLVQHVCDQPNNGKTLVRIKFPPFIKQEIEENDYYLHPGIVDASIQGTANVINNSIRAASLPIGCEIIEIHKSLSTVTDDHLWAEIFSRPSTQEGIDSADLYLFSNTGDHIASFINFTSKYLSHKQNTSDYHQIIASMTGTSNYIYNEFIEQHSTVMEENNEMFLVIIFNDEFKSKCEKNIDLPVIKCNFQTSIHSLSSDLRSFERSLDIVAIVPEIIEESLIQYPELIYKNLLLISEWLLMVFQGISELQSTSNNPKIVSSFQIVSRCSSPKIQSSLIYGCIAGYYRVWLHEKPSTKCRLIELDIEPSVNISQVFDSHVLKELHMIDITTACHVKLNPSENKRFVAYYSFVNIEPVEISAKLFSSEKTYVLFGGCTSMGMYVANWMVQLGAKHLILASRSGFNNKLTEKEAFNLLQKSLANQGVEIQITLLDITSPVDIQYFFESYSNIGGVINMCMELKDSLIENHTAEQIKSGCAPKVLGSLLIHTILDKLNYILDFFIMFSSTTSIFGNEGQFTYAGANAFMDSFALTAQSKTPYFTINLPAIADVGFLTNNQLVREFLVRNGWETVPMIQICDVLASIIYQLQLNHVIVQKNIGILKVNPIKFVQSNSFTEHLSIWKNIFKSWQKILPQFLTIIHQDKQQNELNKNNPQAICNTVANLIATTLGFSGYDQVSNETRLSDLGFHSMAAMELKANISKLFRIDLPISLLLGTNTTIKQIQRKIIDSIKENPENNDSIQMSSKNKDLQNDPSKNPFTSDDMSLQLPLEIPIIIPFHSTSLDLLQRKLDDIIIHLKTVDTVTFYFTLLQDIRKWIENAENEKDQSYQILLTISSLEKISVIDQFSNTLSTITTQSSSENPVEKQPIVIFLFPGQGEQYSTMSAGLYKYNETYRKSVDSLCELISANHWLPPPKEIKYQEFNLRHLLFPSTAPEQLDPSTTDSILSQTEYAQPATFIISYALAQYLIKLGVKPSYCFGHSIGEYLAACISGVLTVVDALDIICHRAVFMSQCSRGKMIAVKRNLLETENLLIQFNSTKMNLEISVCNSEQQTVVGGSYDNINSFQNWLKEKSIIHKELVTSHAYHTFSMRPAADKLIHFLSKLSTIFNTPGIPYMSNLTGELITREQATDLHYYGEHMCKTVQACKNIDNLILLIKHQQSSVIFIEIGPGHTLTNLVKQRLLQQNMDNTKTITVTVLNTLKPKRSMDNSILFEDVNVFLTLLTNLYNGGLSLSLTQIYSDMYTNILKQNLEMRLSYAQERLWFMEQVMPNHAASRITSTFHVSARKEEIFHYLSILINRHPILRTTIHYDEYGYLYHKLNDVVEWTIEEDFSLLKLQKENCKIYSTEWDNHVNLILKSHSTKSFILDQAPLFRFVYLPITENQNEAILHVVCHHLLMDAYSGSLMAKEIYLLLNDESQQYEREYITPPITFFQHALYERLIIHTSDYQQRLDYWKAQLTTTEYYSIPLNGNTNHTDASHYYSIPVDDNLVSNIRQISADIGITINSFLASVLTIVLSRYNNGRSSHVAFGMAEARYSLAQARSLVGCFVNLLIIRSTIHNDLSIKNIMVLIHNLILEAMDNSYPFIEIISKLKLKRNTNFNSLFQVLYNFRQLTFSSNHKEFQTIGHDKHRTPQFDFELHINCYDNKELQIYMLASAQANHLASFIADSYAYILQQICHEKDSTKLPISELSLVSNLGGEKLMLMMNSTTNVDYSDENQRHSREDLVSKFNKSVEQYPNNIAILDMERKIKLTYQQLSDYSTYFAHEILRAIESFPQSQKYIGVYLERHAFVPLTIWSVLKSGAAYIPLDPHYFPAERLIKVVNITPINIIITSESLLTQLKQIVNDKDIQILLCDSIFSLNHSLEQFKNPLTSIDSTAYVEFTSGSTGTPKGVSITHGNLINQFESCLKMYKFNSESICLTFHSFAFDLHAWEIFGTLFSGGCLIILHDARDMDEMFRLCKQTNVTHISMTPSTFKYFVSAHHNEILSVLKCIMLCGEIFDYSLLRDWYQIYSDADVLLVNAFGITETTVINSFRVITVNDLNSSNSWIGHPMKNNYFAVLDEKQQLVPPSIAGELYIGGDCVSIQGYINAPSSNVNFLQLILPKYEHVTRWYRTGDLIMYNGIVDDFSYLGRITQQIKLGAVRIEPQEIEITLNQIQGISNSVVVPIVFNDSLQLVAYLEKSKQIDDIYSITQIRARLQQSLPQIMIPARFIFLSSLPLTNSGKIDRTLLSKLETLQKHTNKSRLSFNSEIDTYDLYPKHTMNGDDLNQVTLPSIIVANGSVERKSILVFKDHIHHQIMNIFNFVVGHHISPTSRFFEDEGTTSLQAIQLVYSINSTFGCKLAINTLYLHSTVLRLADYIRSQSHVEHTPLVHLVLNDSRSIYADSQLSLIFIHPAGGGSIQYINIAQKLSQLFPGIFLYCLERIHKYEGIDLVNLYSETLKKSFKNKKVALIGFSQGGNIAFELAKRLLTELQICFVQLIDSKLDDSNGNYTDSQILSSLINVIDKASNTNHKHVEQYLSQDHSIQLRSKLCKIVASKLNIIPFNNETILSNFIQSFRQDISLCDVLSPDQFPQIIPVIYVAANEDSRKLAEKWENFANINLYVLKSDHRSILHDSLLIHYISNAIKQYGYSQSGQENFEQKQTFILNDTEEVTEKRITDRKIQFGELIIDTNHQISLVKSNTSQLIRTCATVLRNTFSNTKIIDNTFDAFDNLDTGNSCAEPFQPLVTAVQLASREINKYRQYQSSSNIDEKLQNLILQFCKTIKWLSTETDQQSSKGDDLCVSIGGGTTQLWDCILRTTIVRKNDVVLVPSPTYGLFLPQIEMLSGQIVFIPLTQENDFKLSSIQLHSTIADTHLKLVTKWLKELPFKLKNLLRAIYDDHLLVEPNNSTKKLIDTQIDEFVQRMQQIILVKSREEMSIWKYVEDELSEFLCNYLFNGETRLLADIQSNGLKSTLCPGPPRVVALLHINPSVFGTLYTKKDLTELAKICEQQKICVIEDLAYALLQLPIKNQFNTSIATFHSMKSEYETLKSILLFGLSKPFAIADMRIGFAIGKRAIIEQINVILSTTSCFTPVLFQSSISALFSLEHSKITDYLAINAHLYKTKRNLLLACLMGFDKLQYERTIEQPEIDETKFLLEQITQQKKYDGTVIKLFYSIGLSKYFTVCCIPAAGFFIIVNCQPFLQSIGRQYNMKTSLEAALFLSYFYRIQVIPEEMMGVDPQQTISPQLLRLSYSISNENIVEAAFTIFSALFKLNTSTA